MKIGGVKMCKVVFFPIEEGDKTVKLLMNGIQIRPIIVETANLNLKSGQDYDLENLAYEIIHKAWGRNIAIDFKFCNMSISFNGNGTEKNQERKTIVILKGALPKKYFEPFNLVEDCSLVSLDKTTINKIIAEGKIDDGSKNGKKVRIDEIHRYFINNYFDFQ